MADKFDLVTVKFGHKIYAMPKTAAMRLFETFVGQDIYCIDERYESNANGAGKNGYVTYAYLVEQSESPTLATIGPVQFHIALENQRRKEEDEAAKNATKT